MACTPIYSWKRSLRQYHVITCPSPDPIMPLWKIIHRVLIRDYIYTIVLVLKQPKSFAFWSIKVQIFYPHKSLTSLSTLLVSESIKTMGFRIPGIIRQGSFSASKATRKGLEVPKGYLAVYVGDRMRRFVIPISYLLTIPCNEDEFLNLTSRLNELL